MRTMGVEGVRRANLGAVLRLVHRSGPRSRARLTAETGLNRSTVADLVTTLVEAGLVVEREPDPDGRVGRPSPVVSGAEGVVAIGVNPEVDAVEIAACGFGGVVRLQERRPAAETADDVAGTVAEVLRSWRAGPLRGVRIAGLGVAVPGLVRTADGLVRLAPHLGWHDVDVAQPIAEATGLAVAVGNDASLGARAEHLFGAARGVDDIVYLNGGASGIGGGIVLDGRLMGGADGYAGEWGQNRASLAEADRRTDRGLLEDEVSRARLIAALGRGDSDDAALAEAVRAGGAADDEIGRQRRVLAATIANAVNVIAPRMVVLGGFLAALRERDPDAFDAQVRAGALAAPGERVTVRSAGLAEHRLLIGAAEAAYDRLLADPLAAAD